MILFLSSVDLVACLTKPTVIQCDPFLPVDFAGIFWTISELKPLMINAICFIDLHSWIFQSFEASTFSNFFRSSAWCVALQTPYSICTYYASTFLITVAWFIFFREMIIWKINCLVLKNTKVHYLTHVEHLGYFTCLFVNPLRLRC